MKKNKQLNINGFSRTEESRQQKHEIKKGQLWKQAN